MAEIIRSWLRSRLGVIIDLTPAIFGHYCRDGTFLAKLLHSYDIITDSQLNTIIKTSDPALSRVNLRHLRVWLRFIGVICDDKSLENISDGKGTAALHLVYKIFLCLENKDRLHFITLQEEREKYIPNSTKFSVKVVPEDPSFDNFPVDSLAAPLPTNPSLINWHRKRTQNSEDSKYKPQNGTLYHKSKQLPRTSNTLDIKIITNKNEMAELDEFTNRHKLKPSTLGDELKNTTNQVKDGGDSEAAKKFMKALKSRKCQETITHNLKTQLQKRFLLHVWKNIESNQEREVDQFIAKKVLRQSNYEKQMIKKISDIRNEIHRMAGNRQLIERLMLKIRENEIRMIEEAAKENEVRDNEDVDVEYRRLNELDQRIKEKKLKNHHLKVHYLSMEAIKDIIDISLLAIEFKRTNNNYIPDRMWNEWKALFLKDLPMFKHDRLEDDLAKPNIRIEQGIHQVVTFEEPLADELMANKSSANI